MKRPILATAPACLLLAALPSSARTWKEAGSERTIEGDFVREEREQVTIRRPNGTMVTVPIGRLSADDQKFVADESAAKAVADARAAARFKWETDIEVAKQRAKAEKKAILLDFTGSDWCGWCVKLKEEVFSQPGFEAYAKENLVLVELDFPREKQLPRKLREQNDKLAKEYKIDSYPSVILLDSEGREVGRTGYLKGGPEKYVEHLAKFLK